MNMVWMIAALGAALGVVAVSFAAAVTADAVSGRSRGRGLERPEATAPAQSRVLTVETDRRERDWHRVAIRAWATCVVASVIAVAVVGVLIALG